MPVQPPRRNRFVPAAAIPVVIAVALVAGCSVSRKQVAVVDVRDVPQASAADTSRSVRSWGVFEGRKLVIYRPRRASERGEGMFREVWKVGANGVAITGYRLTDGRHVRFEGTVRQDGDELILQPARMAASSRPDPIRIAASEVHSIDVRFADHSSTVLLITGILLMAAVGFTVAIASALEESMM